jgi:hypothetical protein
MSYATREQFAGESISEAMVVVGEMGSFCSAFCIACRRESNRGADPSLGITSGIVFGPTGAGSET